TVVAVEKRVVISKSSIVIKMMLVDAEWHVVEFLFPMFLSFLLLLRIWTEPNKKHSESFL
ncbi:MAG: hypothetical protein JSW53_00710, partial [Candidatus Bathyarchaeota archaeon]